MVHIIEAHLGRASVATGCFRGTSSRLRGNTQCAFAARRPESNQPCSSTSQRLDLFELSPSISAGWPLHHATLLP